MKLKLINPLPRALRHYEAALVRTLELGGVTSIDRVEVSIEGGGRGLPARASAHIRALLEARTADPALVLWPAFGYWELVLDAVLCRRSAVIYHDARPMRPQFGMDPWQARAAGRLGSLRRSNEVLVHSRAAEDTLAGFGWDRPRHLPHPMRPAVNVGGAGSARPSCLVLGQYKPTRSLELLQQLPGLLPGWSFRAVGRGWPSIAGWDVKNEFVPEDEVENEIRAATVLLVPYERFFQSGVLVRAFELCTPAVTAAHEQTAWLYGDDWVGIAATWRPEPVAEAIQRAGGFRPADVRSLVERADDSSVTAWNAWLGGWLG